VPAGTWHVIADGVIADSIDVTFELVWRSAKNGDTTIASWVQHFDRPGGANFWVPFEADETATAIDYEPGDQLVYRFTGTNVGDGSAYAPNGDDDGTGRDTQLTLPK
jgi:hypothetical protein